MKTDFYYPRVYIEKEYRPWYWVNVKRLAREIQSDGCTWASEWLKLACVEHDVHYHFHHTVWGDPITRAWSDGAFLHRMAQRNSWRYWHPWIYVRYGFVRSLGWLWWETNKEAHKDEI